MSYRVKKRCTKKTMGYCLNCSYCTKISETKVKCNAPDTCFISEFNPEEWYCTTYKGFNEMDSETLLKLKDKREKQIAFQELKQYVKKYYTREEANWILQEKRGEYR